MTAAAAPLSENGQVVLWNPLHGAYLDRSGSGFTRRISRAARFSPAEARARQAGRHCHLEIEPIGAADADARHRTRAPRRSDLADLTHEELLRRAVKALRPVGGSQAPLWSVVMEALALTSAGAINLCRRLQLDQNERMER